MKRLSFLLVLIIVFNLLVSCGDTGTGDIATDTMASSNGLSSESASSVGASSNDNEIIDLDNVITETAFPENYVEPKPIQYVFENETLVKHYADNISLYKYCGHWQADENDPHTFVSYWNIAYVEVDFTGEAVYLEFSKSSNINVSVDGGEFVPYYNVDGIKRIEAVSDGKHTVRIKNGAPSSYSIQDHIYFAGASVPKEHTLSRTADKPHYIQFIGDSISEDRLSHAHNSADILGWDYSVAAKSGISLQTGRGYWGNSNPNMLDILGKSVGMEDAFFKLGLPQDTMSNDDKQRYHSYLNDESLDFNFKTGKTPDVVFIFLGTNDGLKASSDREGFVQHYSDFVDKILKVYGNKPQIFIMQALSAVNQERYISIDTAGKEIVERHPTKVTFINRDTVDSWEVEISADGTHPSADGYATLSAKVAEFLCEHVK